MEVQGQNENFNAKFERLKEIVEEFEDGTLGLDDGIERYREARACLEFCRKRLQEAKIELEADGVTVSTETLLQERG